MPNLGTFITWVLNSFGHRKAMIDCFEISTEKPSVWKCVSKCLLPTSTVVLKHYTKYHLFMLVEVDGKTVVVWTVDDVVGKSVMLFWVVVVGISDVVAASLLVLVEVDGKTFFVWTIEDVVGKCVVLCRVVTRILDVVAALLLVLVEVDGKQLSSEP